MKEIKITSLLDVPLNFTGIGKFPTGSKRWYKDGLYHREDGPAIEWANGDKEWLKEGILHRIEGPAVETKDGSKVWYKEGKRHRIDGPAVEYSVGHKEWWIDDQQFFLINLKDHVVLDSYKGKYDLIWYKLVGKDQILEYPDIPGLIIKNRKIK